jgi:hypothetical protein
VTAAGALEAQLEAARAGTLAPVVLVRGDQVLALPQATRLAAALGGLWSCEPVTFRRPESLADLVEDLRTYSLFATGKVVMAVSTGALADRAAAAELFGEVLEVLPWSGTSAELAGGAREAAVRLLQVLRLCDVDPYARGAEGALAELPEAFFGARRGRADQQAAAHGREALRPLLAAALEAGLRGAGQTEVTLLADLLSDGLPDRHVLVLVESAAPDGHPLVAALAARGAIVEAGRLAAGRGGVVAGLDQLTAELERQTGVRIDGDAAAELARRSLRTEDARRGAGGGLDADSTERFAAEYRKLAMLAGERTIGLELVREQVEDRGEQDVWALLDAVGAGRAADALAALERRLAGADDRIQERLAVFSFLATFARRVMAATSLVGRAGTRAGVRSYKTFEAEVAPKLTGAIEGLAENPLKGIKAFPLFRVYQAAGRWTAGEVAAIPAWLLETELRLKGESGDPDAALAALLLRLARPELRPAPARSAGSRTRA